MASILSRPPCVKHSFQTSENGVVMFILPNMYSHRNTTSTQKQWGVVTHLMYRLYIKSTALEINRNWSDNNIGHGWIGASLINHEAIPYGCLYTAYFISVSKRVPCCLTFICTHVINLDERWNHWFTTWWFISNHIYVNYKVKLA